MTKAKTKYQLRGHCQICGRQQAVVGGFIAKHGYTVDYGFFNGTCQGSDHFPIEVSHKLTDTVLAEIEAEALACELRAKAVADGEIPAKVTIRRGREVVLVNTADLPSYERHRAVSIYRYSNENTARNLRSHVVFMRGLIVNFHGAELTKVEIRGRPPAVCRGERRIDSNGRTLVCYRADGNHVYWKAEGSARPVIAWTGIAAWRKMKIAE